MRPSRTRPSVAALLITTEAMVAEVPKKNAPAGDGMPPAAAWAAWTSNPTLPHEMRNPAAMPWFLFDAAYLVTMPDRCRPRRGRPGWIVSDNVTKFTCNAMLAWFKEAAIDWRFIAPGKPMHRPRSPHGSPSYYKERPHFSPKYLTPAGSRCHIRPQRTIGGSTPTSFADRPLLHSRRMAYKTRDSKGRWMKV